jgi:hypothetical protein
MTEGDPRVTTPLKTSMPMRSALACLALLGAGQAMAQNITGQLTGGVSSDGYAATMTNITFSGGTTPAYGGAGVVVCIDPFGEFPAIPSTHTYSVQSTAATVIAAGSTYVNRAEAMIDWVIDHYYTQFVNQSISGYAFNQTLWEITTDYNGTAASLSSTSGTIYKDPAQNWGPEYPTMLTALKNAMAQSTWSDSYRSTTYSTTFLKDLGTADAGWPRYQNMVLVTAVPEPSTYLMMFAGVGALMFWRRRNAR